MNADRGYPWLKFPTKLPFDPKYARLSFAAQAIYFQLYCLAGQADAGGLIASAGGGYVMTLDEIAYTLRLQNDEFTKIVQELETAGFIIISDESIEISDFLRDQGTTSQAEKREKWKERQSKRRERLKQGKDADQESDQEKISKKEEERSKKEEEEERSKKEEEEERSKKEEEEQEEEKEEEEEEEVTQKSRVTNKTSRVTITPPPEQSKSAPAAAPLMQSVAITEPSKENPSNEIIKMWELAKGQIALETGHAFYKTYIETLKPVSYSEGLFAVATSNSVNAEYIEKSAGQVINKALSGVYGYKVKVAYSW